MEYKRYTWSEYEDMLRNFNYTEEQILAVKDIRQNCELMPWDMYQELVKQKVLIRTQKLKKPRSLYVSGEGKVLYLNHKYKKYNYSAYFKDDEQDSKT